MILYGERWNVAPLPGRDDQLPECFRAIIETCIGGGGDIDGAIADPNAIGFVADDAPIMKEANSSALAEAELRPMTARQQVAKTIGGRVFTRTGSPDAGMRKCEAPAFHANRGRHRKQRKLRRIRRAHAQRHE